MVCHEYGMGPPYLYLKTVINNLESENEALRQEMAQKITCMQQTSKERETVLQKELEQFKVSYQEISSVYKTDILSLQEQLEILEQNLNNEKEARSKKSAENLQLVSHLTAEKDVLQQETAVLKQTCSNNEIRYKAELETLESRLQIQIALNDQLSAEVKDRDEKIVALIEKDDLQTKKKSLWKRLRHSLGLRKMEKLNKKKSTSEKTA
ncbi:hypothetical protein GOODEAATRI_032399 [Goodea atripinnis]|uniref:Uncharacterized protein n=1 Tax=Goodea atripinnis TaxID=208336 RepID=A0ABV0PJ34_9TELE